MPPPAFATHDDLKTLFGRPDLDNTRCDLALRVASDTIRNWTRQYISAVTADAIELDGNWSTVLDLPQIPVTAVTSIAIQWAAVPALMLVPAMYQVKRNGKITWAGGLSSDIVANAPEALTGLGYWGGPHSKILVTYNHGFSTIPDDIWDVCLAVAFRVISNPLGLVRESIHADGLDVSTQYAPTRIGSTELTPEEQTKLNAYRRRAVSLMVGV